MKDFMARKRLTTTCVLPLFALLVAASPGMGQEPGNDSRTVRKSSDVLAATAVKSIDPEYPPLARAAGVSGQVVVEVTVNEQGDVITASAVSGHPLLKAAAEKAARGWKFRPTMLSGVPVRVVGNLLFSFPTAETANAAQGKGLGGIPGPPPPDLASNEESMTRGAVEGQLYTNAYFGFSLRIPEGWQVQSKESSDRLMKTGKRIMAGDDQELRALMESPRASPLIALVVFRYPIGSPVPFNPAFTLLIEDVSGAPGIKRGSDYLYHLQRVLQASQVKPTFGGAVYSKRFEDVEFDVLDSELDLKLGVVKQRYYTTIMKRHALTILFAYGSEEDLKTLTDVLDTLKFQ